MPKLRKITARKRIALTRTSAIVGLERFAVMSAVEGLALTAQGRKRVCAETSTEQRRANVLKAYLDLKVRG
jgi:hypothetical protein